MDIMRCEPDDHQIHNPHGLGKEYLDNHAINNVLCLLSNRMGIGYWVLLPWSLCLGLDMVGYPHKP